MHLQILPQVAGRPINLDYYFVSILDRCKWQLLMSGEQVLFYQRRWTGTRCPNWDPVRKQHSQDMVYPNDTCYGTGFVGGYYRALPIYMSQVSAVQKQIILQEEGQKVVYTPKSWSLHEPTFRNGDLIVRRDGVRFWVTNVTPTMWRGKVLRQMFDLDRIELGHLIYSIPV